MMNEHEMKEGFERIIRNLKEKIYCKDGKRENPFLFTISLNELVNVYCYNILYITNS